MSQKQNPCWCQKEVNDLHHEQISILIVFRVK